MPEIIIKPGREKSILRRHPWIFSGAVSAIHGMPENGEMVEVISAAGELLARASYSAKSNIIGRIWTWDQKVDVNKFLFEERLQRAFALRHQFGELIHSNAMRLVHGESDGLPGLIIDQYNDVLVLQILTAGIEYWKIDFVDIISKISDATILYERSDVDVRQLEGLPINKGLLSGHQFINPITITENDLKILVDIVDGHKTGFYLDQRENRLLARQVSTGKKVLDCFSYTGGFAINSLMGGAKSVTLVDSSESALDYAHKNMDINNLSTDRVSFIKEDVFKYLRTLRDIGENFDLIILDPPKFAPTALQAERATRAYKDINLLALKILKVGGLLMTFSCSGGVSEDLFQKIIAGAALDAGVNAVIVERLHQAIDHPVALNFPEGAYLKGFLIEKQN